MTAVAGSVVAAAVAWLPPLRFAYDGAEASAALHAAAALTAALAAYLVYGRVRERRTLDALVLACALCVLALSNLCYGLPAAVAEGGDNAFWSWSGAFGRLAAAIGLAAAALVPSRPLPNPQRQTAAGLAVCSGLLLGIGGAVAVVLPLLPDVLEPGLMAGTSTRPRLAGPPTVLAVQALPIFAFGVAAAAFGRRAARRADSFLRWLAVAMTLAAIAHLDYALYPSLYSHWLYVGDFFVFLSYLTLLAASAHEIRRHWVRLADASLREERRRIAREIHDGVAQELALIARKARRIRTRDAIAGEIVAAALRGLEDARRRIAGLSQPGDEPLEEALAAVATHALSRHGETVSVQLRGELQVSQAVREALVGIAREAVWNALRHGRPRVIHLELTNGRKRMLRIVDDGVGFDSEAPRRGDFGHFGLRDMSDRAAQVGAKLRVRSSPGAGTEVEVLVP